MSLPQLLAAWRERDLTLADAQADLLVDLARRAVALGESLLAYEIASLGLKRFEENLPLRLGQILALARSGATETALDALTLLREQGHDDETTLTLLARTHKDLWEQCGSPLLLRQACDEYEAAYRLHGGTWSGINAGTLAVCLGEKARAASLAEQVRHQCLWAVGEAGALADEYWNLATLGEAALILENWAEAEWYYRQAAAAAANRYGHLSSTRRNGRLLLRQLGGDEGRLNDWMPMPRVVAFVGHMVDQPGRPTPRFPPAMEPLVAAELRRAIDQLDAGFAFASGACGSDLLFLEAMAARHAEINIILPYDAERFIRDSVDIVPLGGWEKRFRAILQRPESRLTTASEGLFDQGIANQYSNTFIWGMAGLRAQQLEAQLVPMAVWDGGPGGGAGGTAHTVAQWRRDGHDPLVIDTRPMLQRIVPQPASPPVTPQSPPVAVQPAQDIRLMALLFADVVGFSKLTEDEIPLFVQHFLGGVAGLIARSKHQPVHKNTWGDGLYFTFDTASAAGEFALELRDLVAARPWKELGFRNELSLRTGLHVGPVYHCTNPVTGGDDYIGTHVSRAARIEPVTPRGQVYASEVFAAIAFAQRAEGFTCDYVGKIGLAKDYGTYPTYHLRPRRRGPTS